MWLTFVDGVWDRKKTAPPKPRGQIIVPQKKRKSKKVDIFREFLKSDDTSGGGEEVEIAGVTYKRFEATKKQHINKPKQEQQTNQQYIQNN